MWPGAIDVAASTIAAMVLLAVTDAVRIALGPWPVDGLHMRLMHHGFDALEVLGVGSVFSLTALLASRIRFETRRLGWIGWLALGCASTGAMHWLVGVQIKSTLASQESTSWLLVPLCLLGAGFAVPAVYVLGNLTGRRCWTRMVALVTGLAVLVVNQVVLPDDYAGEHTALIWVSAVVAGGAFTPWLASKIRNRVVPVSVALGILAVTGILWVPPNAVRVVLLRPPGSVVSWVLARVAWTSPPLVAAPPQNIPSPRHDLLPQHQYPAMPVVVLLTVEAFRGDLLTTGKHDRDLRNLASLRNTGAYFPRAYSTSSQTAVGLTSLFTGRHYSQLRWEPEPRSVSRSLFATRDPAVRFPSLLAAANVDTKSYVGIRTITAEFGITGGFSQQNVIPKGSEHARARDVLEPLLDELRRTDSGKHFFYAHLTEPHEPYDRGQLTQGTDFERYVSEVAVVDEWVARLVELLTRRFPDRGYLIVTGDHGEAFGEHGTRFHSKTLYEEMIHVPLILWGTHIEPKRITERVAHIDVGPTILQLFGLPVPSDQMGESLLPLIEGQVDHLERPLFGEARLSYMLFGRNDFKAIEDVRRHVVEVFDLARDPGELDNLFDKKPQLTHPLVAQLRSLAATYKLRTPDGYEPPFRK